MEMIIEFYRNVERVRLVTHLKIHAQTKIFPLILFMILTFLIL